MASILPNDLDKSGCSSSPLDNCFAAAFWFGRSSSLHAQPVTRFHQSQDTSASAPWGPWSEASAWKRETDGPLGRSEGELHYSLWHFKVILPDTSLRLEKALMLGLMSGLRETQRLIRAPDCPVGCVGCRGSCLGSVLAWAVSGRCGVWPSGCHNLCKEPIWALGVKLRARPTVPPVAAPTHSLQ